MSPADHRDLVRYWEDENRLQERKGYFDYTTRRLFRRCLGSVAGNLALDVGCGRGLSLEYFREAGARPVGLDLTADSVRAVKEKGFPAVVGDARRLPFKAARFDLVYSIGVLEHIPETAAAIREMGRACKPGGRGVVVLPYLWTPLCPLAIVFYLVTRGRHGLRITYGRGFSGRQLARLMADAGFGAVATLPYYVSCFLRIVFDEVRPGLVDWFEDSLLARRGIAVFGVGTRR